MVIERGEKPRFDTERPAIVFGFVFGEFRRRVSEREQRVWSRFLGRDLEVPEVPHRLLLAAGHAFDHGLSTFDLHYIPEIKSLDENFPGWKEKPRLYGDKRHFPLISGDKPQVGGYWMLVDCIPRPEASGNYEPAYPSDPLSMMLMLLRREGVLMNHPNQSPSSRFRVSPEELETKVYPLIANILEVDGNRVRSLRFIEFNLVGNAFHPEWGGVDHSNEWFDDKLDGGRILYGGNARYGGLTTASDTVRAHAGHTGFRPVILA